MEESENRKIRLKAMRIEAAEAEASPNVDTSTGSVHLSNPLAEPSANLPLQENSPVPARFDFYTDPMAAFSGNRRKSQKTYQNSPNYFSPATSCASSGPANLNMAASPCHEYNQSQSSDQRMYGEPLPYHSSGSWRSPLGMASPFPQQLGTPPAVWNKSVDTAGYGFPPNSPMVGGFPPNSPTVGGFPSPGFGRGGSPSSGRGSGHHFNNTPNSSFGQGGSPNPNAGRSSRPQFNNPNPGFGQGGSPSPNAGRSSRPQFNNSPNPAFGQGGSPNPNAGSSSRPQFNNSPNPGFGWGGSPSPNTGRSAGHWLSTSPSPGSGRGRGRGRGFHGSVSARERPEQFYNKSMLEDPWRFLKPVVRKLTLAEEGSSKSWLPKSISGKKDRVSTDERKKDRVSEAVIGFRSSNFSLAESLAASYEEAAALAASYEETTTANDAKNE